VSPEDATATVAAVVAEVVGAPVGSVRADTDIMALPGFSSAALLRIVDGLEQRLHLEFPAEALVAATFATPARVADALCAGRR
jgi:acyl carrier protein